MKVIKNGYKHAETFPLPCWSDDYGSLQYDTNVADELVSMAYGMDIDKYELNPHTLELYYKISDKMKFKIAEVTYESFFTDVVPLGTKVEKEFRDDWNVTFINEDFTPPPEDYEIYNLTLFHYNHPSLKSKMIKKDKNLKGINGKKYLTNLIKKITEEQGRN